MAAARRERPSGRTVGGRRPATLRWNADDFGPDPVSGGSRGHRRRQAVNSLGASGRPPGCSRCLRCCGRAVARADASSPGAWRSTRRPCAATRSSSPSSASPSRAERGPYGGYRLRPGYKLPPLMLTDSEATALVLGLVAARQLGISIEESGIEAALAKILRVLPTGLRERVGALQESLGTIWKAREPQPRPPRWSSPWQQRFGRSGTCGSCAPRRRSASSRCGLARAAAHRSRG